MRIQPGNQQIQQLLGQRPQINPQENADDFGSLLMDAIKEVNKAQADSRQMQQDFMAGRQVDIHDLMIAMEKAGIAMELTMQVRNKMLEAYQEISRMQV